MMRRKSSQAQAQAQAMTTLGLCALLVLPSMGCTGPNPHTPGPGDPPSGDPPPMEQPQETPPSPPPPAMTLPAFRLGGDREDAATGVAAIDRGGDVVLAGYFRGRVDFGGRTLYASTAEPDGYVARYRRDGSLVFALQLAGPGDDRAQSVTLDEGGDIYVGGLFSRGASLAGQPLRGAGGRDGFLARISAAGTLSWVHPLGGPRDDAVFAVAARRGTVAAAGAFEGTLGFSGTTIGQAAGGRDLFVALYDTSGRAGWSACWGGPGTDEAYGVALSGTGDVAITGAYTGVASLGGLPVESPQGAPDGFLLAHRASGHTRFLWTFQATSPGGTGAAVAYDSKDDLYLVGNFSDTADLGGGLLRSAGDSDVVLAKYEAGGALHFTRQLGGPNYELGVALSIDPAGQAIIAGTSLSDSGIFGAFAGGYSPAGQQRWLRHFDGSDDVRAWGVAALDRVVVAGDFKGRARFHETPLESAGDTDVFVTQFTP